MEAQAVALEARRFDSFKGTLGQSAQQLYQALEESNSLEARMSRLHVYTVLLYAADTRNDHVAAIRQQSYGLVADVEQATSFMEPEILSLGWGRLEEMLKEFSPLEKYRFYLSELERGRAHVLSQDQELLLTALSQLQRLPETIRDAAHDGDMRFDSVQIGGEKRELAHGTIDDFFSHPDHTVREAAYIAYTDGYLKNARTLASALSAQVTTSLLFNRARNYTSTFTEALFEDALSPDVYKAATRTCYEHQHLFQRYFRAKAKALSLPKLAEHDIFGKLSRSAPEIPYNRAVSLVLDSLLPLGRDYVEIAKRGLTEERWAHVFPAPGKYSNAFSSGAYGTRPFLLLNYGPSMPEVGTLAHELGHSMHSYFTNRAQPVCYSHYSMTVAETASNLNQVLLRAHILKTADREMSLAVLDEAFYYAHRYLFMMPVLSRIEHLMHSTYARGGAWSAADMCQATVTAFKAAYGDSVSYDGERLGVKWGQFCHFYQPYYFFQYAVGISAAMSIGQRILGGESGLADRYRHFLSVGASMHPQEIFKIVGVDIASKDMYRAAFKVVEGYVQKLEELSA
jgi:oligoendopeptidase F